MIEFNHEREREQLVEICRSYAIKKIRFKHRGRTHNGMDCAGVIICALREMGYDPVDLKVYGREPYRDGLKQVTEQNLGVAVDIDEMKPGDVVLIKFNDAPHHVGLIADYLHGGLSLIHCYGEVGFVVEHRLDLSWKNRVKYAYRFPVKSSKQNEEE